MKKYICILIAFALETQFGKSQLSAESVIGNHAGFHSWHKLPVTLELKDNFVYEMKSYNYQLETENTTKGRWRIEGDKIVLTDVVGTETEILKYNEEFNVVGENGVTCVARFYQNKNLKEFWKSRKSTGC
jgi:hypothetical protein